MKYHELGDEKRDAIKEFLIQSAGFYKQEELWLIQKFYQFFLYSNGAGIVILTTYMGALADRDVSLSLFILPLALFIIGAFFGAMMIWYTLGVSARAMKEVRNQMFKIFTGELDIEQYQDWGFSPKGLATIGVFQIISGVAFLLGIVLSLSRIG